MVRAVTPIPFVKARFFDRCGKPLAGGKVYTYEANTTTPKVTYKDPYGLTPNTNPIILDAAGEADIYLDGTYRIRITDRNDVLVNDVEKIGSWFSDNLQDTLDNISGAMDEALKPVLQNLEDAINTAAAAGAGANGWTAFLVKDASGKTQQEINDARIKPIDSFANITDALNWVKTNVNNHLYAKAGVTYRLPSNTTLFFSRVVCPEGEATFIVPSNTYLNFLEKTDGSEVFVLKNLRILVEGHRNTLTTSTTFLYSTAYGSIIRKADLQNLKIYGLTDINNIDSWQDDTNMTRMSGVGGYKVIESSTVKNIKMYGSAFLLMIDCTNNNATHEEQDIYAYNVETIIYHPMSTWKSGYARNINIINNLAQRDYWAKRDAAVPLRRNGKNCIMCEADHDLIYRVSDITAKCAVEKSVYNTSKNSFTKNIVDDNCFNMATIKSAKNEGTPSFEVSVFDLTAKNPTNTVGVQDTYGWANANFEKISIVCDTKSTVKPFLFSDLGTITYKNVKAQNTGICFALGGRNPDDAIVTNVANVNIIDSEFIDCYDSSFASVFARIAGTGLITNFKLDNLKHYSLNLSNIAVSSLPAVGLPTNGITNIRAYNSSWFAKNSPFHKATDTTYLEVVGCNFTLKNSTVYSQMFDDVRIGTYAPKANIFDHTIDFVTTSGAVPPLKFKARFKKLNNSGIVTCADYWSDIDVDFPVNAAPTGVSLAVLGDKSFELTATYNDKFLRYYWDATTKTISNIINFGGLFATTLTIDKINVYINTSNNQLVLNFGNGTWTGGSGNLAVKLRRM